MILAAAHHVILAFFFALVGILLIGVILLQRGKGVGLAGAFGGTGGHTAFGAKTGDFLMWVTVAGAGVLLAFTIILNFVFVPTTVTLQAAPMVPPPMAPVPGAPGPMPGGPPMSPAAPAPGLPPGAEMPMPAAPAPVAPAPAPEPAPSPQPAAESETPAPAPETPAPGGGTPPDDESPIPGPVSGAWRAPLAVFGEIA